MRKFKLLNWQLYTSTREKQGQKSLLGFTLIEVMVALVILSLVAGSLTVAVSQATRNISQTKQHQFATWIAQNQLSLYMLKALNSNQGKKDFGGFEFNWTIKKAATDTENFNKITITVANAKTPNYRLANIVAFKDER